MRYVNTSALRGFVARRDDRAGSRDELRQRQRRGISALMRLIVVLLTGVLLIGTPADLTAQEPVHADATRTLIISERAIAAGLAASPPVRVQRSRDSAKNGAIAGAVIGGIAAAVVATYFCKAIGEAGDPPCWRGVLAVGAVGAGIGAAAGAGH